MEFLACFLDSQGTYDAEAESLFRTALATAMQTNYLGKIHSDDLITMRYNASSRGRRRSDALNAMQNLSRIVLGIQLEVL